MLVDAIIGNLVGDYLLQNATAWIYLIRCLPTGRVYVGTTRRVDPRMRWRKHLTALRAGKHHSFILQRAWDKYGESAFVFEVIDVCDAEAMFSVEQIWLDSMATRKQHLLNVSRKSRGLSSDAYTPALREKMRNRQLGRQRSPAAKQACREGWREKLGKTYSLLSPDGVLHTFSLINEFATQQGLRRTSVAQVLRGETRSVLGWSVPGRPAKSFVLLSPDGVSTPVSNLKQFCRDHKLPYKKMHHMCRGGAGVCKGWRVNK